jgi:hypothetical protein
METGFETVLLQAKGDSNKMNIIIKFVIIVLATVVVTIPIIIFMKNTFFYLGVLKIPNDPLGMIAMAGSIDWWIIFLVAVLNVFWVAVIMTTREQW